MNRQQALLFVNSVDNLKKTRALLKDIIANDSPGWQRYADKLLKYIDGGFSGPAAFSIIAAKGNIAAIIAD